MNTKSLLSLAAMVLVLAACGCNKAGKLNEASKAPLPTGPMELKLKWPLGEKVVQDMDMKTKTETTLPSQPKAMQQTMTMGQKYSMNVLKETADGGHEVEIEFLRARMSMDMPGAKIEYDSDKKSTGDSTNPIASIFGKMVGCKIQCFLDASNSVERVEGTDELMDRLSSGAPAGSMTAIKGMMSEGYFKQMMSSSRFLPSQAVSPGDSWPVQLEFSAAVMGTLQMNYTFTLQSWEKHGKRNCARMDFTGTIKTVPGTGGEATGLMGMTMTIKDGTSSGTSWFDPELGIIIDTTMNQDMSISMLLPKNPKAKTGPMSQPQTVTSQINQEVRIKLDSLN